MTVHQQKLGDIARIYVGLPTKASDRRESGVGNVLTVRSLTDTGINGGELESYDFNGRDVEKYRVKPGDVLLSARSTSLSTAVVPPELDGTVINATVIGVRCLPALEPRLLIAWLNHPEGLAELVSISQSATLQMNITVSGLSELLIPVPPTETQRRMVALLEAADEAYSNAIQAAEDRRRIARQVVVGQILESRTP